MCRMTNMLSLVELLAHPVAVETGRFSSQRAKTSKNYDNLILLKMCLSF